MGYPSGSSGTLPEIFSDHGVGTDYSLVYAYHAAETGDPWKLFDRTALPIANDLHELTDGWTYWIKISASHTWQVEY